MSICRWCFSEVQQAQFICLPRRRLYRLVMHAEDNRCLVARPMKMFANVGSWVHLRLVVR